MLATSSILHPLFEPNRAAMAAWCAAPFPQQRNTAIPLSASACLYLASHDAHGPRASPRCGEPASLPPVQIQVGDDKLLLDDLVRYAARPSARVAERGARFSSWRGHAGGGRAGARWRGEVSAPASWLIITY